MEVEYHVVLLHRLEDRVVRLVVLDAALGVGGDAARVALDAAHARLGRACDLVRRQGRGQVERADELGLGRKCAERGEVVACLLRRCDGRHQVGHHVRQRHTALGHVRADELRHLALTQVHVEVGWRRHIDLLH